MSVQRIPRTVMNKTVYLTKPGLTIKTKPVNEMEGYKIEHVLVNPNPATFYENGGVIQKGLGNWQLFYQGGWSTPLIDENGKEFYFSVGDTITLMPEKFTTKIVALKMWNDDDGLHHYEIWMD